MEVIAVILFVVVALYVVCIGQLASGFSKVKAFERSPATPKTTFSIIVPFRNEAKNLPQLLESVSRLNYPDDLFELILVDDFSKDDSQRVYINWRVRNGHIETTLLENLRLSGSPKKDAIGRAVPILKHEWMVTTDGDCSLHPDWLLTLDNFIQQQDAQMVAGAVVYKTKNNWFHQFQQLDLLSLQAATIGSFGMGKPFMCNGANFAYTKKFFTELGGFGGLTQNAGGDDVLLLQKAVQSHPDKVAYLKHEALIVTTKPENDLFGLFMQRVRWAAKTTNYSSRYAQSLAVVVLLMNVLLVVGCWLLVVGRLDWKLFLGIFMIKYLVDYLLLWKANVYLQNGKFLLPLASSVIYPVFSSLVGLYSLFFGFSWKGRKFQK